MTEKKDINDADEKDLDDKSKDKDSDAGDGKEKSDAGDGQGLTKEDIQTMVTDAITIAVKDIITPEIDRRISGAAKTIYKKAGVKEEEDDSKKADDADQQAKLKDRLELAAVYAETTIKEDTGKLDEDEQGIIDTLIGVELAKTEFADGQSVKDLGKIVGIAVLKKYKKLRENIENKKIEALRKAGQVINVTEPGRSDTKVNEYDQGKKMAEKRHPAKV